jgi:hypothetical protein
MLLIIVSMAGIYTKWGMQETLKGFHSILTLPKYIISRILENLIPLGIFYCNQGCFVLELVKNCPHKNNLQMSFEL